MTVISDGSRTSVSRSTPRIRAATSSASSTGRRPEAQALPRLVQLDGEGPVHVEVAGLDRQVRRLERAPTLLVDDVEGADEPDVVDEVGGVAGAPAAIQVADEGGAADRAEHEVRAAEDDVRARGCGRGGVNSDGASATSSSTWAGSSRTFRGRPVDDRAGGRRTRPAPGRPGPPSRSRTGSAATPRGSSRPGPPTGSPAAGTG